MSARVPAHLAIVLLAGLFGVLYLAVPAAAVPGGFADGKVADVPAPVALDFTPDGRMLVTSKLGQLYAVENGQRSEVLDLADPDGDGDQADSAVCSNSERGLLGVAVDPDFRDPGHKYVYLYYTYEKFDDCPTRSAQEPVNRVSRFTLSGDTVNPASERVSWTTSHRPVATTTAVI